MTVVVVRGEVVVDVVTVVEVTVVRSRVAADCFCSGAFETPTISLQLLIVSVWANDVVFPTTAPLVELVVSVGLVVSWLTDWSVVVGPILSVVATGVLFSRTISSVELAEYDGVIVLLVTAWNLLYVP